MAMAMRAQVCRETDLWSATCNMPMNAFRAAGEFASTFMCLGTFPIWDAMAWSSTFCSALALSKSTTGIRRMNWSGLNEFGIALLPRALANFVDLPGIENVRTRKFTVAHGGTVPTVPPSGTVSWNCR
jgi:hypothetical protein